MYKRMKTTKRARTEWRIGVIGSRINMDEVREKRMTFVKLIHNKIEEYE
jgi:hypothetical protein